MDERIQCSQFLFLTELKLHYMFFFQLLSVEYACFCYTFSAQYSSLVTRGGSDGIILRPSNGPGVEQWHRDTMIHSPTHLVSANTETQGVGDQGWGGNQIFKNKSPLSSFHLPGFPMISISAQRSWWCGMSYYWLFTISVIIRTWGTRGRQH